MNKIIVEKKLYENEDYQKEYCSIYIDLGYGVKYIKNLDLNDYCQIIGLNVREVTYQYMNLKVGEKFVLYEFI